MQQRAATFVALLGALSFSTTGVLVSEAQLNPFLGIVARNIVSIALVLFLVKESRKIPPLTKDTALVTGIAVLDTLTWVVAFQIAPIGVVFAIGYSGLLVIPFLDRIWCQHAVRMSDSILAVIGAGGVVLVVNPTAEANSLSFTAASLCVLTALVWAAYFSGQHKIGGKHEVWIFGRIIGAAIAVFLIPLWQPHSDGNWRGFLCYAASGLGTGIGFVCINRALKTLRAQTVFSSVILTVPFGILWAFLLKAETLGTLQLVGVLMTVATLFLSVFQKQQD